jgi:membrane protease YdiL (CAAX protease family)
MIGILVLLIVSWVLLHFIENKNLMVLGVLPIKKSIFEFSVGMVFVVFVTLIFVGLDTLVFSIQWKLSSSIDYQIIANSIWYNLKSAITEDLLFRGALLYILVSKLGFRTGLLLSACTFGVYHWFSYGMLPGEIRIIPLLYVFSITGFVGYVWAYTFIKTCSIMMPLGFHLGSNFILSLYFKNAAYGEMVFSEITRTNIENQWLNLLYLISKGMLAPLLTLIFVKYWVRKYD